MARWLAVLTLSMLAARPGAAVAQEEPLADMAPAADLFPPAVLTLGGFAGAPVSDDVFAGRGLRDGRRASTCEVVSSIAGGLIGAFVGGAAGTLLERAVYDGNPEAGLTGFFVGVVLGVAVGSRIARGTCDHPGGRGPNASPT